MSFGQGGPQWGPGAPQEPQSQAPDWAALAEASESRNRRKKWLMIGGGALATAVIAGIVATAVVSANGKNEAKNPDDLPASEEIPNSTSSAGPTFAETKPPPPPDPKEFISDAKKDKAPLSTDSLFPGKKFTKGSAVYKKGASTGTKKCADATQGTLGPVLNANDCERLMRVTYVKDGVAVTIGVAVFENDKQARKAKDEADKKGNVMSLPGKGVPSFCRTSTCFTTINSYGRYGYFTTAGFTNGKAVTAKDEKVFAIAKDLQGLAFQQIHKRGEMQASAAAGLG
ncbi:hypothetical protein RCO28_17890 [Streptomyces sp. LHD-70]|uniref:hypothetical protein n=1 Tax=Streptomyces sp. LHD-70 TaxID=3072140 RepID=UPI0028103E3B|nr:hypothetical protein [Streptomyces sp. LHD-70]MDQ8704347.1 hypothetical protein [Streptomyces sp. LHD-70]